MAEGLCSVGIDVGTTTTQMVVSELTVENRASGFAVPRLEITKRTIRYRSPVHFTPLLQKDLVDAKALQQLIAREYEKAGITPRDVDTGAVIITGETSRKENARAVLQALSGYAGEFVVATAGPDLESVLAARGAGAVAHSERTGKQVLHMDIGGGTSNLALIKDGKILGTGCLNVGGRLIKTEDGRVTYVSPVVRKLTDLREGQMASEQQLEALAEKLTQALEMAAGLREETELLHLLQTREAAGQCPRPQGEAVISFSGGVADCIEQTQPDDAFGDMGPILGRAIRKSRLCRGSYMLGSHTIRATVIGAGCHSTTLSGSTVFYRDVNLPMKNLPVAVLDEREQYEVSRIREKLMPFDREMAVLALPGEKAPSYAQVQRLARAVRDGVGGRPVILCLEADMAKALGQCLSLLLPPGSPCLCIDRVQLSEGSFLDIGTPVGPAIPVVIKTLVLG